MALLHELISRPPWSEEVSVVEAHSGKGVYASTSYQLRTAHANPEYRASALGVAQTAAFGDSPNGLGLIEGLQSDELPYAGSAVIHAFELSKVPRRTLTLMDHDAAVRDTVGLVFKQPALAPLATDLRLVDPGPNSEASVSLSLERGDYSLRHVLHFDPFAFVMDRDASTRSMYKHLVADCDERVGRTELAAATLFVTWGSNNRAALDDLDGAGYQGGLTGGYCDLAESIDGSRRVVLTWCWELYFSLLVVVPSDLRSELLGRLTSYVQPFRPWLKHLKIQ